MDYNTSKVLIVVDFDFYKLFVNLIFDKFKVNLREFFSVDIIFFVLAETVRDLGFEGYLFDFIIGDKRVMKMFC